MSQAMLMSGNVQSRAETARPDLDRAVQAVRERADDFARLGVAEKMALVRACMTGVSAVAREWVDAACLAKGLDPNTPPAGEEWAGGPMTTMRNLRLLAESLEEILLYGKPRLGQGVRVRPDGRVVVDVFPCSTMESAIFTGFTGYCLMQPGLDERAIREKQASFYGRQDPKGRVSLILGAGNVSSIPPMDALYKMFNEGQVCVVKMNPVNEWSGPFLERALLPLIERGYLRIVYGGGDVGAYLVNHAGVDDVHITGSDKTHDMIVWGPVGPERERRIREKDPVLKKTITSELGNVSPVAIVPGEYSPDEIDFQARNVATMVENNASFNCNAAKVLILGKGWPQRGAFLDRLRKALASIPPRKAYYPGAFNRYESLTQGRPGVERFGEAGKDQLSWALIPGVDASNMDEKLFQTEPFCGILSETEIASTDPVEFLKTATAFMNDRVWGTLNATFIIAPKDERDPRVAAALDKAIVDLRYGTVTINHWAGLGYGFVSPPWGGHPSATLANIQSGLGWVHNTFMLEGIDKAVVRGPIRVFPKPAWFFDNKKFHKIGEKLLRFEADPSWLRVPGLAVAALLG